MTGFRSGSGSSGSRSILPCAVGLRSCPRDRPSRGFAGTCPSVWPCLFPNFVLPCRFVGDGPFDAAKAVEVFDLDDGRLLHAVGCLDVQVDVRIDAQAASCMLQSLTFRYVRIS